MIIGIDGNEANVEHQVGVSVYTIKLLSYFKLWASAETSFEIFLKHPPLAHMPEPNDHFRYTVVAGPIAWSRIFMPLHLMGRGDLSVFFSPAHYAPQGLRCPLVVTIHDLSYFYYPDEFLKKDLYKLKTWTLEAVTKASAIIAVSKTTKKDILHYYDVPEQRVSVVYNGFEKPEKKPSATATDLKSHFDITSKKYFLYVGTLQPRKNLKRLIQAFRRVLKSNPEFKLVLTGKEGWLYDQIVNEIQDTEKQSIILTGFQPDEVVNGLYKNAFAFVQPSLYEGFGIPILEAMAQKTPVIASMNASLPEVGGEACLYFDPDDEQAIAAAMQKLIDSPEQRQELVAAGQKRIQAFSWETAAKQTLAILKEAATK